MQILIMLVSAIFENLAAIGVDLGNASGYVL